MNFTLLSFTVLFASNSATFLPFYGVGCRTCGMAIGCCGMGWGGYGMNMPFDMGMAYGMGIPNMMPGYAFGYSPFGLGGYGKF